MVKVEMAGERRKVANGGTNGGGRHAMGRRRGRGDGEGERAQRRRREGCGIEGGGMGRGARPSKRMRLPSSFTVGATSRMHGSTIVDCRRTGPLVPCTRRCLKCARAHRRRRRRRSGAAAAVTVVTRLLPAADFHRYLRLRQIRSLTR
uniref:Uncharacterized protein n=1 Tax=Oryza nivara TaxID=4536 RepID=A0A0E0GND4_ORYNI